MTAREYQTFAAQSVWNYFEKNTGNPLILMPTGTGKSHVIAILIESMLRYFPQTRIQVLTHVKELIQQNYNKFVEAWPTAPAGIYSAGLGKRDIHNSVVFAGIQSVGKKAHAFGWIDLLFVDEAHLVSPAEATLYNKYVAGLKKVNPALKVVGLTATGYRIGHGKIHEGDGALFTDVCVDMTGVDAFNWFISEGYLLPLVPKKMKLELDTSGVHLRGGEFIAAELQNAVDKADITMRALREACELGINRRKWLIFASGVEHAQHVAEALDTLGITCGVVYSGMGDAERDKTIKDLKSGALRAVANNNILTTGYDDPEIDLILILRPTASAVLWVQMLGRGTRPCWAEGDYDLSTKEGRLASIAASHKQNCLVLDFAGNTRRLGPINDPVIPRKKGEGSGTAPVKECTNCNTYNHASARVCCACGAEFTFAVKLKQAASTEELIKGEIPRVEPFKVDSIFYQQYQRAGKPAMMRVTYYCGLRKFDEYVCLEHPPGFALKKAHSWWRRRSLENPVAPESVHAAITNATRLKTPTHLRIWVNKQFPEIMDYDFEGTAFGTQERTMDTSWPTVQTSAGKTAPAYVDQDDDIPF